MNPWSFFFIGYVFSQPPFCRSGIFAEYFYQRKMMFSSDKKFVFHIFYAMIITAAHLFFGRCAAESDI